MSADELVSSAINRKKELMDTLVTEAQSDESFARVLSALSGYQSAASIAGKKGIPSLNTATSSSVSKATTAANSSSKKRNKPATSGSRFNRLSALTQAMRTGIISDDEGSALNPSNLPALAPQNNEKNSDMSGYSDSEDFGFEGEEAELHQLKKMRRMQNYQQQQQQQQIPGSPSLQALLNNSGKEEVAVLKVISVPYDSQGSPILPLSLNMITVHQLGEIVYDRPAYHNKRYILPVGFTTSRSYLSVMSPDANMVYFSTILDNGPAPLYQVTPEGHPEMTFQSASTTGAWAAVSKAAAAIRGKDSAPSVSGPDYFGLANPTVSMLIEQLPNSEKCESYTPKKYEVSNLVGGKNVKKAAIEESTIPIANEPAAVIVEEISLKNTMNEASNNEALTNNENSSTADIEIVDLPESIPEPPANNTA